jgi:hypothetical protein
VNWRLLSAAIIAAGFVLFAGANAHLVYVAVKSQPDCVPHLKISGEEGSTASLRAANSAC